MSELTRREMLVRSIAGAGVAMGGVLQLLEPQPCLAQYGRRGYRRPVLVSPDNPSIAWNSRRCEECGDCYQTCSQLMTVSGYYDPIKTGGQPVCIQCGQCSNTCEENAITERYHFPDVQAAITDPDKIVVATTSPAVRVALGECFGLPSGGDYEGQMVASLRKLGFDYVLDTTFAADLTISEETAELVRRITSDKKHDFPMFTSCCPAWVSFAEIFYPETLPHISSAKSPIMMQGAVIKTWFAEKHGLAPERIVNVAIAPCTAKKFEITRPEMNASGRFHGKKHIRDMDYVVTTRELSYMLRKAGSRFSDLPQEEFDSLMGRGSGAAVIFGNTGGVTEAALRDAWKLLTDKQPPDALLDYTPVRGLNGVREASPEINGRKLRIAVVHGTGNARRLLDAIKRGEVRFDFVEVMACPGGCIGGGGQPKRHGEDRPSKEMIEQRIAGLYHEDEAQTIRLSSENPEIKAVYREFLGEPLGERSESLLHTSYTSRASLLGG